MINKKVTHQGRKLVVKFRSSKQSVFVPMPNKSTLPRKTVPTKKALKRHVDNKSCTLGAIRARALLPGRHLAIRCFTFRYKILAVVPEPLKRFL